MSGAILSVHSEYHPLLMGSQSRQMTKKALRRISRNFFLRKDRHKTADVLPKNIASSCFIGNFYRKKR